jgi:two-component system, NtrC family, nitrogen regulation sensor histidine kinase GlnL
VLNSVGDAVILVDARGKIALFNPAAEQITGRAQAQVVGRSCAEAFKATPVLPEMVNSTFATGQTQARTEELYLQRGRAVTVRLHTSAIWDHAHGRIRGTVLTIHDLSYHRTLEEDARRAERLAHLGTLVAGLAHEVKNPLGGIKGAAQLLELKLIDRPDVTEYTTVIVRETNRLSKLVDELLLAGVPRPPVLLGLNIHRVIQEVLEVVKPELSSSGIALRAEFDPSLPETRGDAGQLTQVLLNLVQNAIEAMRSIPAPTGHRLAIRTRMETDFHLVRQQDGSGKFLRVEIADTGPGLPTVNTERLFEPFYTTKSRGTGLGLAICQRIIAAHGGAIRLENQPHGGAMSTVSLPLAN